MKVPIVECPHCKAKLQIEMSDEDIVLLIAKRLEQHFEKVKEV